MPWTEGTISRPSESSEAEGPIGAHSRCALQHPSRSTSPYLLHGPRRSGPNSRYAALFWLRISGVNSFCQSLKDTGRFEVGFSCLPGHSWRAIQPFNVAVVPPLEVVLKLLRARRSAEVYRPENRPQSGSDEPEGQLSCRNRRYRPLKGRHTDCKKSKLL